MIRRLLLACALLAAPAPALAAASPLAERLDEVVRAQAPAESHVGVSVISLATGEPLYEHDARKLFTPASVQKLVTASAALSALGLSRRFATRLLADGVIEGGRLRGHLYLRGEGDPVLEAADLEALANELKARGIREVAGDVIADGSLFEPEDRAADGWAYDDLAWGYAARPGALVLHRNSLDLTVAPGARAGEPARWAASPATGFVRVSGQPTTLAPGAEPTLSISASGPEAWTLSGGVPAGAPAETLSRAIADPARYAGTVLQEALTRRGIAVSGTVRAGRTPASARPITAHLSPPLAELVRQMNKQSDNMIAETLLLHLGVRASGAPGTWRKGLRALDGYCARAGWRAQSYRLADGSGLSRYNAVSPGQLTGLLRAVSQDPLAYPGLLISLPVAGVDGTLATRLTGSANRGRTRTKTGTMSGVSCLVGYATTARGEAVAVAVMVNGFVGGAASARALQDALLAAINEADGLTP